MSPPYTCHGGSVSQIPIKVSERSLGRVVSPDFTLDDVSHVSYGCVCLSRAYVIVVVGFECRQYMSVGMALILKYPLYW